MVMGWQNALIDAQCHCFRARRPASDPPRSTPPSPPQSRKEWLRRPVDLALLGMAQSPARLGVLLSGAGSTYANLASRLSPERAEIALVVAPKESCGGVALARQASHPVAIAASPDEVTRALREAGVEWVAMCGWMLFWDPPGEFIDRTLNIHPSLLPAFGGKGMFGARVHQAVLAQGCKLSGCTVHLVTGSYDSGPILAQQAVPVHEHDTPDLLQARVQAAERDLYPRAIAAALGGGLHRTGSGWWLDY
jgi:phosphoribosylglycinamide formyltransferase-1